MRSIVVGVVLLAASAAGAQAGIPARHLANRPFVVTVHGFAAPRLSGDAAPLLGHAAMRYEAQPSGLDRFDPASVRVLGGEIGGNGVKGGAVVSLTWPTAAP